ncbi:MAG TPA: hypothetical protein VG499_01910, partial [Actinomycetota bacterium]|nr:hypothetical protein [Actinomycetota bacterium]
FLAAVFAAIEARNRDDRRYFTAYLVTAAGMASGLVVLLVDLFGDQGRHARSAVGVAALPLGFAVEVEMVVRVRPAAGSGSGRRP